MQNETLGMPVISILHSLFIILHLIPLLLLENQQISMGYLHSVIAETP
jgi:hypothetical protein